MAQLRTIGRFIEGSGLDMCWIESDLYGPSTVKQIIEGKHVRRGQSAHLITLQALHRMYLETFFQHHSECKTSILACANERSENKEDIKKKEDRILKAMEGSDLLKKMDNFDKTRDKYAMFKVWRHYMQMVMEMMEFVRAVKTGDWDLHLKSLSKFTRYFFAHDMLNYARMIPLYLAEMQYLNETDPDVIKEFKKGNWVVNKNEFVSFCAVGADHALEHINRSMKVAGGLVGITLNQHARDKFFLIAPEMARLAEEAKTMSGLSRQRAEKEHHNLSDAKLDRENKCVNMLESTIRRFTNPFTDESGDLFNLITKVVVPDKAKEELYAQSEIGKSLLKSFVEDRISSDKVNIWSKMKKRKLQTWKSNGKKVKVPIDDKVVELQEDRSLFARLMLVAKGRPDTNIEEAIGPYEFSVVPRSLFASDGSMLHCSAKSILLGFLENLQNECPANTSTSNNANDVLATVPVFTVDIVDGMAEVQSLDKQRWIQNCSELADHVNDVLFNKYKESDEVRLIFDRYDVQSSLKTATRLQRQGKEDSIYYRKTDSTQISKVPMRRLLSHQKTKMELTEYLGAKALEYTTRNGRRFVVSWGCKCKATTQDVNHLQ